MSATIFLVLIGLLFLLILYVATRDGKFHYERSGVIQAPPEVIFPYLSDFHKGQEWSPYVQMDPKMKVTFTGDGAKVGSSFDWEGNKSGSGRPEFTKITPPELVELKLTMFKPFKAENQVRYRLSPEEGGTRFSWSMSGEAGFLGKLMEVFMDCEKMAAKPFTDGINNLKRIIESSN